LTHYHPDPDHTPDGYRVDEEIEGNLEDHPLWQRDNVILMSVGVDIGSAGTQVLFSRVHMRRHSIDLSSRYLVVDRETLFESPVSLTPYASETLIDARRLGQLVDTAYHAARLHPNDIDTGVVILTGEALRRENSEPIARILSEKCGDLVCATAGHHMEATLAAHGSGAVQLSAESGQRLLNIDVGGGTTKLSIVDRGRVVSTAAIHIGGRLVAFDDGVIERLDPAGAAHALRAGVVWQRGGTVTQAQCEAVAQSMADDLVAALTQAELDDDVLDLYLTDPIGPLENVQGILCSGGVAEYIYRREARDFGDLGKRLGRALRERIDAGPLRWPLLGDSQGIRATALGCSEFTAQLSGNTGYISDASALLPRRNLKVLRPEFSFREPFEPQSLATTIRTHLEKFEIDPLDERLVLAFHWDGTPRYSCIRAFAQGICLALGQRVARRLPCYVILDADIAMTLGRVLHEEFMSKCDVLVVDSLTLWDFDSLDIGRVRQPSMTVPVTIKSLIFADVAGGVRRRELVHHQPRAVAGARH